MGRLGVSVSVSSSMELADTHHVKIKRTLEGTHFWVIDKFDTYQMQYDAITSPEFELVGHKWKLVLLPRGKRPASLVGYDDDAWMSLYVECCDTDKIDINIKVHVVDNKGQSSVYDLQKSKSTMTVKSGKTVGWKRLWAKPEEWESDLRSRFLTNNQLRIRCIIKIKETSNHLHDLSESMQQLLNSGEQSDVVFEVDKTRIPAHRAVLSARSDYFKGMFSHKMAESSEGVIKIDDVQISIFRELLRFIYTGRCRLQIDTTPDGSAPTAVSKPKPSEDLDDSDSEDSDESEEEENDDDSEMTEHQEAKTDSKGAKTDSKESKAEKRPRPDVAMQLLMLADRFQVSGLVSYCSHYLAETTTIENAVQRLVLADQLHVEHLKNRVLAFIWDDTSRLARIMETDDYDKLSRSLLHEMIKGSLPESERSRVNKRKFPQDLADSVSAKKLKTSPEGLE